MPSNVGESVKPGLLIVIDVHSVFKAIGVSGSYKSNNDLGASQVDIARIVDVIRSKGDTTECRPLSCDAALAVVGHTHRLPLMPHVRQVSPPARISERDPSLDSNGTGQVIVRIMAEDYMRVDLLGCPDPGRTICLVSGDANYLDIVKRARYATCNVEQWFWTSSSAWSSLWLAEESDQHRSHGSFTIHDLTPYGSFLANHQRFSELPSVSAPAFPLVSRHIGTHQLMGNPNTTWAYNNITVPDVSTLSLASLPRNGMVPPPQIMPSASSAYMQLNDALPPSNSPPTMTTLPASFDDGLLSQMDNATTTSRVTPAALYGNEMKSDVGDKISEDIFNKYYVHGANHTHVLPAAHVKQAKIEINKNIPQTNFEFSTPADTSGRLTASPSPGVSTATGKTYASVTKHAPDDDWVLISKARLGSAAYSSDELNTNGNEWHTIPKERPSKFSTGVKAQQINLKNDVNDTHDPAANGADVETLGSTFRYRNAAGTSTSQKRCWLREFCCRTECPYNHTEAEHEYWSRNNGNRYYLAKQKPCGRHVCNPERSKWGVCTFIHEERGEQLVCAVCLQMHDRSAPCTIEREGPIDDEQAKKLLKLGFITERF